MRGLHAEYIQLWSRNKQTESSNLPYAEGVPAGSELSDPGICPGVGQSFNNQ